MDSQIHLMEAEAYYSVLRAFFAQSDALSWGKEGLITDLRKELMVSDDEHREILGKISSDDSIKSLREWRRTSRAMDIVPSKRLKVAARLPIHELQEVGPPPALVPSFMGHGHDQRYSNTSEVNTTLALVPAPPLIRKLFSTEKVKGSFIAHPSRKKPALHLAGQKPRTDVIKLRVTDNLIREVESVCGGENPDPAILERAKFVLMEHEKSLMDAIENLGDVSDDDYTKLQQPFYSTEGSQKTARGYHHADPQQLEQTRYHYIPALHRRGGQP